MYEKNIIQNFPRNPIAIQAILFFFFPSWAIERNIFMKADSDELLRVNANTRDFLNFFIGDS